MTSLKQKREERFYAESANRLLGHLWTLVDIKEPPDFEVRADHQTFGLEVRRVFADLETDTGSKLKKAESLNSKRIQKISTSYYAAGGKNVSIKFSCDLSSVSDERIIHTLLNEKSLQDYGSDTIELENIKIYRRSIPQDHDNFTRWVYINDKVGWVKSISANSLQGAIDKKAENLPAYKQKYSIVDLLLVADRTWNSGSMQIIEDLKINNPGFRTIYLLLHPLKIIRISD